MKFVALDVETANPDMASICQIGIVHFEDGKVVDSWSSLVNPKDYFDDMNVSIHGIEERDVRDAPDFKQASSTYSHLQVTDSGYCYQISHQDEKNLCFGKF